MVWLHNCVVDEPFPTENNYYSTALWRHKASRKMIIIQPSYNWDKLEKFKYILCCLISVGESNEIKSFLILVAPSNGFMTANQSYVLTIRIDLIYWNKIQIKRVVWLWYENHIQDQEIVRIISGELYMF